jgi:hypothetical protein
MHIPGVDLEAPDLYKAFAVRIDNRADGLTVSEG